MPFTSPILTKLMPAWQLFVQNSHTDFYENLTSNLVASTSSRQMWTWSPQKGIFLLQKECLKTYK
jgi:hypothetical protein